MESRNCAIYTPTRVKKKRNRKIFRDIQLPSHPSISTIHKRRRKGGGTIINYNNGTYNKYINARRSFLQVTLIYTKISNDEENRINKFKIIKLIIIQLSQIVELELILSLF